MLSTPVLSLYRPVAKFFAQTCVAKWSRQVAFEGLKRNFVPTNKLEFIDLRSLNNLAKLQSPGRFKPAQELPNNDCFAGNFLTCQSHDWMRLLCDASVQCFVNISWIVTKEDTLNPHINRKTFATLLWFYEGCFGHWELRAGKRLFFGHLSKSLQWVLYAH